MTRKHNWTSKKAKSKVGKAKRIVPNIGNDNKTSRKRKAGKAEPKVANKKKRTEKEEHLASSTEEHVGAEYDSSLDAILEPSLENALQNPSPDKYNSLEIDIG